jgi:hypothetical protein
MNPRLLACSSMIVFVAAVAAQAVPSPYQCLTLRSDGQSGITNISAFAPIMPLRPSAFTPADFASACGGAAAVEVQPAPSWCSSLIADPLAKWIATTQFLTPVSAMYCQSFQLPSCGVQAASIKFAFCVDDQLGDPAGGPNPIGVYLNGQPIPGFGGLAPSQTTWTSTTIAPLLVAGQNRLQVYVRDTGASVAGVMYSATLCYVDCRSDEVIKLHSGNGPAGGPDTAITMLAGAPMTAIPTTPANLANAASGPPAAIVWPSPLWCPSLNADPQAKWISTNLGYGPSSAIYAQSFTVTTCSMLSASLSFSCSVSSWLGDPAGTPSVGLFVNQYAIPASVLDGNGGGNCNLNVTANVPIAALNANASNTLCVYVRDVGHIHTGVMYSAVLTVKPCPPPIEVVTLRSGNGVLGGLDGAIRYLDGPPAQPLSNAVFTLADFATAASGPAAHVVANSVWAPSLIQDPAAKWVSSTMGPPFTSQPGAPRTALFAHPFNVNTCAGDLKKAKLTIHYCADDGLGDPIGSGPNPLGIYLNTNAIPGTAGDITTWPGTNQKTITINNVAPWLVSGPNMLHVYQRDRLNGISGVMYSLRIEISACDWLYFGDPCSNVVPNTLLSSVPTLGSTFHYQIRGDSIDGGAFVLCLPVIGLSNESAGGIPLPLDLGIIGGTGCHLLVANDLLNALLTGPDGNADMPIPLPLDPAFDGQPLFFQTLVLDPRNYNSNPLGLSATRGIAVDCRRP